jgi:hypothetical protein
MTVRQGRVRPARLTDLAALGELSRLSHRAAPDDADRSVRSLGLPVQASHVSVFSLFRMTLGAFQPHDPLYVYEQEGRLAGLARAERDNQRDEWTVVELDAVDQGDAGDIRFRLVQHLLRDGSKRGAARFHVSCADEDDNVELFMQAGFVRYGEETVLHRAADEPWPQLVDDAAAARARIRPAAPLDALTLTALYRAVTPAPVARLEGYRLSDWERLSNGSRIPRSSLTPILRFADMEVVVQECAPGGSARQEIAAFAQVGVAKEDQPHYLRVLCRAEHDPTDLIRYGLALIGDRSGDATRRRGQGDPDQGVLTAVRTYESPLDRRLEEAGFRAVSQVSLLLKETLVRVAEPALVPAVR